LSPQEEQTISNAINLMQSSIGSALPIIRDFVMNQDRVITTLQKTIQELEDKIRVKSIPTKSEGSSDAPSVNNPSITQSKGHKRIPTGTMIKYSNS